MTSGATKGNLPSDPPENGYVRPARSSSAPTATRRPMARSGTRLRRGGDRDGRRVALGRVLNVEVPASLKVVVNGRFGEHVSAKDLILHLIGRLTAQGPTSR